MIHSNKILVWTQYKNKQNVSRCISGNFAGIIIISWSDKLCGRKHKIKTHALNIENILKANLLRSKSIVAQNLLTE